MSDMSSGQSWCYLAVGWIWCAEHSRDLISWIYDEANGARHTLVSYLMLLGNRGAAPPALSG